MAEVLERALELVGRYDEEVRRLVPEGVEIFDVHLHLGRDIDGMVGDYDQLEELMAAHGISRAFMFCLDEPDRHPAFSAANDRTLAWAERSGGRLVPYVRLDLNETPIEEATRCLDAGARGIKLHPRAQGFGATDERLGPVFALAAERRVPILIHGGRGLPPIAAGLAALVERYPETQLIIAHAGIADMAHLAAAMAGRRGVVFDTSTWSPIDLLDFFRQVPPEQVVYASDYPYGQYTSSLFIASANGHPRGLRREHLRLMLGATAGRLADGEELPEPSAPRGARPTASRCSSRASTSTSRWRRRFCGRGQSDTMGVIGLAINTCAERDGHPSRGRPDPRPARGGARPVARLGRPTRTGRTGQLRDG